jgi:hypothetical protein
MSLILDALNRARDDVNAVPGLATHHRVELVAANRRQYLLWVALSVAVVVIAWLIVERYSAPRLAGDDVDVVASAAQPPARIAASDPVGTDAVVERAVAESTVAESATTGEALTQVVVESVPTVVPGGSPAVQDQSLPAAAVSMARLEAQAQSQQQFQQQSQVVAAAGSSPPAATEVAVQAAALPEPGFDADSVQAYSPEENAAVAQLYSNPPKEEPLAQRDSRSASESGGASREESIDIDRILREAREEVANASLPEHPVPFLIDLSQQVKDSIPTVYYLRHDYSSNPSLSTVVLNSKTLSVGGSPVPGMKIEEILPDSVVLNYQGTQFRLRALNSWVNL